VPGPSYFDNLKAQLDLPAQRLILVPQGFIAAGAGGLPDDPDLYARHAAADPAVILIAPFTWFDRPFNPGVRSQPALAAQWRYIGQGIATANPPEASPPLPEPVAPRLQVEASDVRHFSVLDLTCNTTGAQTCAVELEWQFDDASQGTQLFVRTDGASAQPVACAAATAYVEIPWVATGVDYVFELYRAAGCASASPPGVAPLASIRLALRPPAPATIVTPPSYQGLWWNAPAGSESGWGVSLAHQGNTIFAIWYTYDALGAPAWLGAVLRRTVAGSYDGELFIANGPAFDAVPFDPAAVVETVVGHARLTFADLDHGTFAYTVSAPAFGPAPIARSKGITRQVFGASPVCAWGGEADLSLATNYQDLWWSAPAGSEPGWGIGVAHQGDTIFATWFSYGDDGQPRWLAFAARRAGAGSYVGDLFSARGPPLGAGVFDPAAVTESVVGTASLVFSDGNSATFGYAMGGVVRARPITRQVFSARGTSCR
jgi:hypothetical protein